MTRETVHDLLNQLLETILAERESAKNLDMRSLAEQSRKKEALLSALGQLRSLPPEERDLARRIKRENLRNAYLFKATLNWIQDTMEFFGKKTVPATYGQRGTTQHPTVNGRLLSGRI